MRITLNDRRSSRAIARGLREALDASPVYHTLRLMPNRDNRREILNATRLRPLLTSVEFYQLDLVTPGIIP